ncbi:MAG: hypothetical protein H0X43_01850 [Nitrosospira sp.]|nr:hypothetical protein [Nitrosospira sp.]
MAEQHDDKPDFRGRRIGGDDKGFSFLRRDFAEIVRPIDKKRPNIMFLKEGLVQSRLWQDSFKTGGSIIVMEKGSRNSTQSLTSKPSRMR